MKKYNEGYWASRSSQYNKTNWVKNKELINYFLKMLPNRSYNQILEVGIGTGAVAEQVVQNIGPLIGIDISKDMIEKIENPLITTYVGDAHKLQFEDKKFDLIYMRNVIHYIDSPESVFSEIYRCLKPGAQFLFSQVVPPSDSLSEEYDQLIGRDIHYPTQKEILKWLNMFTIMQKNEFILKDQSIMNWLNNTCSDESQKLKIIARHKSTSEKYKSLVNYYEENDDIFVDIKHFMVSFEKG